MNGSRSNIWPANRAGAWSSDAAATAAAAQAAPTMTDLIGAIPYRLALAGGWIDQPFVSQQNPRPPGSMVVVAVEPAFRFMDRSGICSSTREIALRLWPDGVPACLDRAQLVQELYEAENRTRAEPSGSQDMIGLIYPGINRLDFDCGIHGGVFPAHIESLNDATVAHWLERVLHILPVAQRPEGYGPLGIKNLAPDWIHRLGQTGCDCFQAIRLMDAQALGRSFNECMQCWEIILPHTLRHPTLTVDLPPLLRFYQSRYPGAMFSGCGGGYLFVVSEKPVPGAFNIKVRLAPQ
jgi:hypothetical protein